MARDPNFLYEVAGNEATGQATFLATLATRSGFKFFGQGKYRDRLVKQNGKWLIAHRCVDVDRLSARRRKMWPNLRQASPIVGSYTISRKRAGSDISVR